MIKTHHIFLKLKSVIFMCLCTELHHLGRITIWLMLKKTKHNDKRIFFWTWNCKHWRKNETCPNKQTNKRHTSASSSKDSVNLFCLFTLAQNWTNLSVVYQLSESPPILPINKRQNNERSGRATSAHLWQECNQTSELVESMRKTNRNTKY